MAALLVCYILLAVGALVAGRGLRAGSRPARLVLTLVGAALMIATAVYYARDIRYASDALRYGLSAVAVIAALQVAIGRRPVHCALALLVVFLSLAGVFVSFQAEFLGAIEVSINAGAVVVTFLFILMLIDLRLDVGREVSPGWDGGTAVTVLVLLVAMLTGLAGARGAVADRPPRTWYRQAAASYGAEVQDTRLGEPDTAEVLAREQGEPYDLRPISGYAHDLGWELYTRYTVPFEVASLILTVAVVGAVAVGRKGGTGEVPGEE